MKLVIISDTHGAHEALGTLSGDVLIHSGDLELPFEQNGDALGRMDDWFARQDFAHILSIGDNHDFVLERRHRDRVRPPRNATFLHETAIEIDGVTFWGASRVPFLRGHAFFADDNALLAAWSRIPDDVDVLITHTPPVGTLDQSSSGDCFGCPHLTARLERLSPTLHCFGHVNASSGVMRRGVSRFVNASSVRRGYEISVPPNVFDLDAGVVRRVNQCHG